MKTRANALAGIICVQTFCMLMQQTLACSWNRVRCGGSDSVIGDDSHEGFDFCLSIICFWLYRRSCFPMRCPFQQMLKLHRQADQLVYADFEKMQDNRPVSARGGYVQLFGGQQNPGTPAKFKGIEGINAPELVHLKAGDPNKAAMFSYELPASNQYANVTLEIQGLPGKDGKQVAEDVTGYKYLTLQVYAKGSPGPTGVTACASN